MRLLRKARRSTKVIEHFFSFSQIRSVESFVELAIDIREKCSCFFLFTLIVIKHRQPRVMEANQSFCHKVFSLVHMRNQDKRDGRLCVFGSPLRHRPLSKFVAGTHYTSSAIVNPTSKDGNVCGGPKEAVVQIIRNLKKHGTFATQPLPNIYQTFMTSPLRSHYHPGMMKLERGSPTE